jgi:hypothetical protein
MVDTLIKILFGIAVTFVLYLFSMLPLMLAAEAGCLEKGYPEATVVWNYKAYCINLDGMVVGKVVSAKSLKDSDETN